MANGKDKVVNWKDIIWIALIIISGIGAYFSSKATIEKDMVKLDGRCNTLDLKISANEAFVKRDIEIIKEDIDEIKKGIKQLVDFRLAESGN